MNLVRPCPKCPFRRSVPGYLRRERAAGIVRSLIERDESFHCHETVEYNDDGEPRATWPRTKHCAGAAIMLLRAEMPNQGMRIAYRLGITPPDDDPDVMTPDEFIEHHDA